MAFGRREEQKEAVSTTQTVIAKDLAIKGDVKCEGVMRVEGLIEGNISGNGEITIAESGKVKGDIQGRKVIVIGHVEGNIIGKESVEVLEHAVVIGDITAEKVSIEEGASVEGKVVTKKAQPIITEPPKNEEKK
ncbi:MAG: bactofilin family protein [Caldisericum sp.]|uniref:bactofilin family protein n=1 Tax=Caldisericum TaxID=693074 RepID=UPI003C791E19